MLVSGKKIRALRNKKQNILTLVLSEKKNLNEAKNQIKHIKHGKIIQVKVNKVYKSELWTSIH
jgi:hypothetical protein